MKYLPPVLFLAMIGWLWQTKGGSYAMSYFILGITLCLAGVSLKLAWIFWRSGR